MKKKVDWIRIIAGIEIFGGIYGAIFSIKNVFTAKEQMFFYILASILFVISLYAGIYLWKKTRLGLNLSIALQVFQILQFSLGSFLYLFYSGFYIALGKAGARFMLDFGVGSNFLFYFTKTPPELFRVNLVAVVAMIYLMVVRQNKL